MSALRNNWPAILAFAILALMGYLAVGAVQRHGDDTAYTNSLASCLRGDDLKHDLERQAGVLSDFILEAQTAWKSVAATSVGAKQKNAIDTVAAYGALEGRVVHYVQTPCKAVVVKP